jgi:hypothetical protein
MKPHKENLSSANFQIGDVVILNSDTSAVTEKQLQMTVEYIFDDDTVDVVYKNPVTGKLHRDRLPTKTLSLYENKDIKKE